jgi:hypothetical protein
LALDPWISWPTLHRGVGDTAHEILHLGQADEESDRKFPPIWRLLRERGLKVGVFGSLHSSAVPPDVAKYSFYLPDYFDANVFAHPRELLAFQELNLAMTRQSARNVTRKMPIRMVANFLRTLPTSGVTFATIADSAGHLVREAFNRSLRIRRRSYQPLVMADLFMKQLRRSRPDFATFYTNHVAAAMHRYWGAMFPEDYAKPLDAGWIGKYSGEIGFAMDKFDAVLTSLVHFAQSDPQYVLLIASSMGQAAIPAEKTDDFLTVTDLPRFMAALGVPSDAWQARPAMVPVQNFVIQEAYRSRFSELISSLRIGDLTIANSNRPTCPLCFDERERGFFQVFAQFDNYRGKDELVIQGRPVALAEAGFGLVAHEDSVNCTAQHVPEGSLLVYDAAASLPVASQRSRITTLDIVPSILKSFGFEVPGNLTGQPSVILGG